MSEVEIMTLSEDEIKLVEFYRRLLPSEKQLALQAISHLHDADLDFFTDGKKFSLNVGNNAAVQIGNHNKQCHKVTLTAKED